MSSSDLTRLSPQKATQDGVEVGVGCESGHAVKGAGGASELRKALDARMLNGQAFDCADIIGVARRNGGTWRQADAAIQRLRRAGKIQFYRDGRRVIWSMV